jgi:hypothetical protein
LSKFEKIMSNLLQRAGAKVAVSPEHYPDEDGAGRVDMAIFPSDDTQSVVLIEAKAGRLTEERLARAEQQVRQYVIARRASLGVVLYYDTAGRAFPPHRTVPRVIRLSIEELAARLTSQSLTKVMSDVIGETLGRM